MVSFYSLWENMSHDPTNVDSKAMAAIRTGLNIGDDFWDNFIQVCNNPDSLAELLDVRSDQVSGWGSRIKENLEKVHKQDSSGQGDAEQKTKVLDTGAIL